MILENGRIKFIFDSQKFFLATVEANKILHDYYEYLYLYNSEIKRLVSIVKNEENKNDWINVYTRDMSTMCCDAHPSSTLFLASSNIYLISNMLPIFDIDKKGRKIGFQILCKHCVKATLYPHLKKYDMRIKKNKKDLLEYSDSLSSGEIRNRIHSFIRKDMMDRRYRK